MSKEIGLTHGSEELDHSQQAAVEILNSAIRSLNGGLSQIIDKYLQYDYKYSHITGVPDKEKSNMAKNEAFVSLGNLFSKLISEITLPIDNDFRFVSDHDTVLLYSPAEKPKGKRLIHKETDQTESGVIEVEIPFYRHSNFRIKEDESGVKLERNSYSVPITENTDVYFLNVITSDSEKRIGDTLEDFYKDTLQMDDNSIVVFNIGINNTEDRTMEQVRKFLKNHKDVFVRIITVPPTDKSYVRNTYKCITWNILHEDILNTLDEIPVELNKPALMAILDDDVKIVSPGRNLSLFQELAKELRSKPEVKTLSPSLRPIEREERFVHPYFYRISNVQKEVLGQSLPKNHSYGGFMMMEVDKDEPVVIPCIPSPSEDVYLDYLYSWNLKTETDPYKLPSTTSTQLFFKHPEDSTLMKLIERKSTQGYYLENLYNVFDKQDIGRILKALQHFTKLHRESVDKAMAQKFGVTSEEFLGGLLFSTYLVNTVISDGTYTA